jgi:NADH-quinone oxidoreductase subunit M
VLAGLTIILSAVYMLNMIRKVFFGETNAVTSGGYALRANETLALGVIVVLVFVIGLYPGFFLNITRETSDFLLQKAEFRPLLK